jgi:hypothetical protein
MRYSNYTRTGLRGLGDVTFSDVVTGAAAVYSTAAPIVSGHASASSSPSATSVPPGTIVASPPPPPGMSTASSAPKPYVAPPTGYTPKPAVVTTLPLPVAPPAPNWGLYAAIAAGGVVLLFVATRH